MLFDLDRLEQYDDPHGHQAGDALLRQVATAWSEQLRSTDLLARFGGDEYCAALPGCSAEDARTRAARLLASTPAAVSASAGVSEWIAGETVEPLVERADRALYEAKAARRRSRRARHVSSRRGGRRRTPAGVEHEPVSADSGRVVVEEEARKMRTCPPVVKLPATVVAAALAALAPAAVAAASAADKERIHLTAAGQAAAKAMVLKRADLGSAAGWTGGAKKPDLSPSPPCASFHPKQSDLVLNGAAETTWKHAGLQLDSEAQVLETARMVKLDWKRTVLAPQILTCIRAALHTSLSPSEHLVSVRRTAFPRVAAYTASYRVVLDVETATGTVRVMSDVVVFGAGRTELTLSTTAPFAARKVVRPAEVRIARTLAGRIRA